KLRVEADLARVREELETRSAELEVARARIDKIEAGRATNEGTPVRSTAEHEAELARLAAKHADEIEALESLVFEESEEAEHAKNARASLDREAQELRVLRDELAEERARLGEGLSGAEARAIGAEARLAGALEGMVRVIAEMEQRE